jgi:hypothetical protein
MYEVSAGSGEVLLKPVAWWFSTEITQETTAASEEQLHRTEQCTAKRSKEEKWGRRRGDEVMVVGFWIGVGLTD